MSKKPFYNAVIAAGYIALIILALNFTKSYHPSEGNLFVPMTMLSLLVFSAALMGFLFFYQPVLLISGGKHGEAAAFFLKTLGVFACLMIVFALIAFFLM